VNRIWQRLFGQGLVEPADDLGAAQHAAAQQDLLDYLAWRFVEMGWSPKKLIREIVMASAYQMSTAASPASAAADPENRLLSHQTARPIEAAVLRDTLLLLNAQLEETGGGPLKPNEMETDTLDAVRTLQMTSKRRSVYLPAVRGSQAEVLRQLEESLLTERTAAKPGNAAPVSLSPTSWLQRMTHFWAESLLRVPGIDDSQRIARAYREALGRPPSASELSRALLVLKQPATEMPAQPPGSASPNLASWERLCLSIVVSEEFTTLR
jgi:hypothetical protein